VNPEAIIVLTVFVLVAAVIEWLQRRTDSPIMRTRVNDASDDYFRNRQTPLGQALDALGAVSRDDHDRRNDA
jgi:hypothetical protein